MPDKKEKAPERTTRAWQYIPPEGKDHNRPWSLCTLNIPKRKVDNTVFDAQVILLDANFALQYVILDTALEYEAQIDAMLRHVEGAGGELQEMNLKSESNPKGTDEIGVIPDRFIPRPPEVTLQLRVGELEEEGAAKDQLIAELEAERDALAKSTAKGKKGAAKE